MKTFALYLSLLFLIVSHTSCKNQKTQEYLKVTTQNGEIIYYLTSIHNQSLIKLWHERGGDFEQLNPSNLSDYIPVNDGDYEGNDYISLSYLQKINQSSDKSLNTEDINQMIDLLKSHQILNAPSNIGSLYFYIQQDLESNLEQIYTKDELYEIIQNNQIQLNYNSESLSPDERIFKRFEIDRLQKILDSKQK